MIIQLVVLKSVEFEFLFCDYILHYYILEFSKPRGFSNVKCRMCIHAFAQASMTLDRKVTY